MAKGSDARSRSATITKKGGQVLAKADTGWDDIQDRLIRSFGPSAYGSSNSIDLPIALKLYRNELSDAANLIAQAFVIVDLPAAGSGVPSPDADRHKDLRLTSSTHCPQIVSGW